MKPTLCPWQEGAARSANLCEGCGAERVDVLVFGRDVEHEETATRLCRACVTAALDLFAEHDRTRPLRPGEMRVLPAPAVGLEYQPTAEERRWAAFNAWSRRPENIDRIMRDLFAEWDREHPMDKPMMPTVTEKSA